MNRKALIEVLDRLKDAQKRWCAEEVDDAEEMWLDIPEMLNEIVPKLEKALECVSNVMRKEDEPPRLVDFLTSLEKDDAALAKALGIVSVRCDGNEDSEGAFDLIWRRFAEREDEEDEEDEEGTS